MQTGAHTSKDPELGWGQSPRHSPAPRHCYHQDEQQRCAGSRVQGFERRAGGLKHGTDPVPAGASETPEARRTNLKRGFKCKLFQSDGVGRVKNR